MIIGGGQLLLVVFTSFGRVQVLIRGFKPPVICTLLHTPNKENVNISVSKWTVCLIQLSNWTSQVIWIVLLRSRRGTLKHEGKYQNFRNAVSSLSCTRKGSNKFGRYLRA